MTLDELKKAEESAYNHWMYYEAAERAYDFDRARVARDEYWAAKEARENREKAEALIDEADDDSILGLVRQVKKLAEQI